MLSLPKRLRGDLHHHPGALDTALRILLDAIERSLRADCDGTGAFAGAGDEALANAREAIEAHLGSLAGHGEPIPQGSEVTAYLRNADYAGWVWAAVEEHGHVHVLVQMRIGRAVATTNKDRQCYSSQFGYC
ncbi:type II toxin-antitoxin system HicB family antitoxin [Aquisalimonas sp.]|uniref:type II toxin-antitoxin system HicB family antitoxin n=1 Tax=Aquisalimonas sp. TaxID=1872621 RepID=UPI003456216B